MKTYLIALFALLALGGEARAQGSCSPSVTTPITFTGVNPLTTANYDTSATLSITCSGYLLNPVNTFCFSIGAGTGGTNGAGERLLAGPGSSKIRTQIFQDSNRTVPWTSATAVHLSLNLTGNGTITIPIYVRLYADQTATQPGAYSSVFSGANATLNYGLLSGFLGCTALLGGTSSTSFTVQTTLAKSCLLSVVSNINFGNITSLSANVDTTGSLSMQCTSTTAYEIALDLGTGGATNPAARKMRGPGSATLTYGLYQDAARSVVWGNTTGAGGNTQTGTGTGNVASVTVYGRVPSQTMPATGSYTDSVVATITY